MSKKEVRWVWFVYGNTYLAANSTDIVCRQYGVPVEAPKFFIVSAVNILTTLIKDKALAKMFGTKAPGKTPLKSLGLWGMRDCLTILAAFIIPPILSERLHALGYSEKRSQVLAQFMSPVLLQIFTTPLHILGFDIYNNPRSTFSQRIPMLQREYFKSVAARMLRMTPAYGIGGVLNLKLM